MRHKVALLIPHYNDRDGLPKSVGSIDESGVVDLFIVDDGSADITREAEIRAAFKSAGKTCLIRLSKNSGVAAALNAGLREILRRGYEYVARRMRAMCASPIGCRSSARFSTQTLQWHSWAHGRSSSMKQENTSSSSSTPANRPPSRGACI